MKRLFALILLVFPTLTFGQFGVDSHLSSIPFFGVNYELKDRIRPELRIGTDTHFDNLSLEGVVTYDILNKKDYEFYAGLGGRIGPYTGFVLPLGFNLFPFEQKNFGFVTELAPILGEDYILRGSLGIRYQFKPTDP